MQRRSGWRRAHWQRAHWRGVPVGDLVLAGALLVMAVASVVMGRPREGPAAVCLPVAVVMAAAVGWRRRAPLRAAVAIAVAAQAQTFAGASPGQLWSLVVYLLAVYSVAAHLPEGAAAIGGAILVGGLLLQELQDRGSDYLFVVIVFGGAWLVGRAVRGWQSRATLAETHQRDVARLAVSDERIRMSRELHDVVAHGLSVIAVQADAAEAALAHDPVLAAEPVRAIKAGARQSLQELRQMLQVLRDDEDASPGWPAQPPRPAPGIGALAELIQGVRAAGLPIEWVLSRPGADAAAKPADDLAGGVELAVYRIVQEALTNVLKHAGGVPTRVRVRIDESAVDVEVCNAAGAAPSSAPVDGGRTADGGRGLIGVRERVAALHGSVEAGPIHAGELAGGYRLHARLPRADVNEPSR